MNLLQLSKESILPEKQFVKSNPLLTDFFNITTLGIYIPFYTWIHKRPRFLPLCNNKMIVGLVLYLLIFIILPAKAIVDEELLVASSTVILTEQVRMLMKSYAFVRSTASKFLKYKVHADMKKPVIPDFSKYLYFFFAPILIYRDINL
ncbi:hypothetical protein HZH68_005984 [Vespula germanica]|uniref:Uncharacterized protein n=1 Tax=Vespula germanica TaxID=30212 RepID=A0A834NBT3_VESGE|nr:hypothetical protein HZH68_005984 [Vespula germanica]